jgi:hypothetical protein
MLLFLNSNELEGKKKYPSWFGNLSNPVRVQPALQRSLGDLDLMLLSLKERFPQKFFLNKEIPSSFGNLEFLQQPNWAVMGRFGRKASCLLLAGVLGTKRKMVPSRLLTSTVHLLHRRPAPRSCRPCPRPIVTAAPPRPPFPFLHRVRWLLPPYSSPSTHHRHPSQFAPSPP